MIKVKSYPRTKNLTKLNIGCGWEKLPDFINIDKAPEVNPDQVVNIEKGIPFEDNRFEEIFSSHCLEHVTPDNWRFVLEEISRVAKHGCLLRLKLPFDNVYTRTNIDHFRTFHWDSFLQLEDHDSNRHYYSKLRLHRLHQKPNRFLRFIYHLFPNLMNEVKLEYIILKE